MANYALAIKPLARKELDALDDALFARIERKITALAINPRPSGCTKLKGHLDEFSDIERVGICGGFSSLIECP